VRDKTVDLTSFPWNVVLRVARWRGVHVWLVGGAVRDALLGRPVHDWDFAVDRDALALARAVGDAVDGAYFPLDATRGTGRVVLTSRDGPREEIDFALLRGDTLQEDLSARDFTINAMALDANGALIDPLHGAADLEAGLIRVISEQAFRDDPVRLLRAVRLEAELGSDYDVGIEPWTAALIRRNAALLTHPSAERIRDEFTRTLAAPGAAASVQRLDGLGVLTPVVSPLEALKDVTQSPPHRFDVWTHTLVVLEALEGILNTVTGRPIRSFSLPVEVPTVAWGDLARVLGQFAEDLQAHLTTNVCDGRDRTLLLKLAALLHDVGKLETRSVGDDDRIHFYGHEPAGAKIAASWMRRLRFSQDEITRLRILIKGHLRPPHLARADRVTRRAIYRYFKDTGDAGVEIVLLSLADHLATWGPNLREKRWARRLEVAELLLSHYFDRREETVAPPPLISGRDLLEDLALSPGPEIGRLLEAVREAQAAGEITTREEALALSERLSGTETP
jgi:putative nucleotidyltransferase with HDIG domain